MFCITISYVRTSQGLDFPKITQFTEIHRSGHVHFCALRFSRCSIILSCVSHRLKRIPQNLPTKFLFCSLVCLLQMKA